MSFKKQTGTNRPVEFYGRLISQNTLGDFPQILSEQECPFLKKRCVKQRKSDPTQTIGACAVGYQGSSLLICPHRFIANDQIFHDCVSLLSPQGDHYQIVPEIQMPGGNIDYFLAATDGNSTLDYLGIEIQSLDTTSSGGIWAAREDVRQGILSQGYDYGINWRMSAKTILMQMLHKADSFQMLGKKLVLVVQHEFFTYLSKEFRTGHLRDAHSEDTVQFHIYDAAVENFALHLHLRERKSTTAEGIAEMLVLGRNADISQEEVLRRIASKIPTGRLLGSAAPLSVSPLPEESAINEQGEEDH